MPKITEIEVTKERNYINDPKDKFSRAKLGVTVRVQLEEGEDAAQVIGMARKSVSDALEQQIALELERGR